MEFSITEDQKAIQDLAGQIFSDKAGDDHLLALNRAGKDYDEALWTTLAEQGILGLTLPEDQGGSGLGLQELCMVLEQQGSHVAPVPLFASLVLGALPIIEFGTTEQKESLLKPLAEGKHKLTAAIAERAMNAAKVTPVVAAQAESSWTLNGSVECVQDGAVADHVLVPVQHGDQSSVFIVPVAAPGVTVTGQKLGLLGDWNAKIEMQNVTLGAEALLGDAGQGDTIMNWLEERANVAHCALQTGVSETAMKRTAEYTTERKQFGVPIGSFQALAMRMADSYIDVEAIRSTYWLALWRLTEGLDARAEIRTAKFWACEGAHRVVCTAQHLHGGMGADVEYPIHRYFLWSKMISYSLGGDSRQLEELGALLASDDSLGLAGLQA